MPFDDHVPVLRKNAVEPLPQELDKALEPLEGREDLLHFHLRAADVALAVFVLIHVGDDGDGPRLFAVAADALALLQTFHRAGGGSHVGPLAVDMAQRVGVIVLEIVAAQGADVQLIPLFRTGGGHRRGPIFMLARGRFILRRGRQREAGGGSPGAVPRLASAFWQR